MNIKEEVKEQLINQVESTSAWRLEKADEFPEDAERNNNSSNELVKLHTYIEKLSTDHALFLAKTKVIDATDSEKAYEEENYLISRYGFHRDSEDPEAFVNRLTELWSQVPSFFK